MPKLISAKLFPSLYSIPSLSFNEFIPRIFLKRTSSDINTFASCKKLKELIKEPGNPLEAEELEPVQCEKIIAFLEQKDQNLYVVYDIVHVHDDDSVSFTLEFYEIIKRP
jgi:hypothetical protein